MSLTRELKRIDHKADYAIYLAKNGGGGSLPEGSTPDAPSTGEGTLRYNPTTEAVEFWNGTEWKVTSSLTPEQEEQIVEEVLNTDTIKDIEAKTPWVTPEMFGAVGDGTTDDTIALQSSINSLRTRGGILFLAAKQYKITSRLNLLRADNAHNIKIIGSGIDSTVLKMVSGNNMTGAANNCIFNLSGFNSTSTLFGFKISDMTLQGDVSVDASAGNVSLGVGIRGYGVSDGHIYNVKTISLNMGIAIGNASNVYISNCLSIGNLKVGYLLDSCKSCDIKSSVASGNSTNGIRVSRFVGEKGCFNINIDGNRVFGNKGNGIEISTNVAGVPTWNMDINIIGNYCYENYGSGIITGSLLDGAVISQNSCFDNNFTPTGGNAWGKDGIHIETLSKNIIITDNVSYNTISSNNRGNCCGILVGEGSQIKTNVITGISSGNTITVANTGSWTTSPYFNPIKTFEEVGYSSPYGPARIQDRSIFNTITELRNVDTTLVAIITGYVKSGESYVLTLDRNVTILTGSSIVLCVEPRPENIIVTNNNCRNNTVARRGYNGALTHDQVFGVEIVPELELVRDGSLNIILKPSIPVKIKEKNITDIIIS